MLKKFYLTYTIIIILSTLSFTGCNNDDINTITEIVVSHPGQPDQLYVGSTYQFKVTGNNSEDITNESTIYVNGNPLDGNTYTTSQEPGEYTIHAVYQDITSNTITVSTGRGFKKNVLIEDYTGTWCGWCPRVAYAIVLAKQQSDQVVAVAVHQDSSTEPDPFVFEGSTALGQEFGINGLPEGRINRIHTWTAPEPDHIDEAISYTGFSPYGIAIESEIQGNQIHAAIKVKFANDADIPLKLVVYLLENNLIHDQTNYTHDYFSEGYENPLPDFEHNDVLRDIFTGLLGDSIPDDQAVAENIYSYNLTKDIPTSIENHEHMVLVAFITNANTNEVLNVREAEIGINQDFEEGE